MPCHLRTRHKRTFALTCVQSQSFALKLSFTISLCYTLSGFNSVLLKFLLAFL